MTEHLPELSQGLEHALVLFTLEGNLIDQNAAAESLLGYSRDELPEVGLADLTTDETDLSPDDIKTYIHRAADGESHSFEWQIHRKNGEHRWINCTVSQFNQVDDPHVLGELRDLTEYKARGRRLRLLYRVLRHNLRNEMTVIQGRAEELKRAIEADDLEQQVEIIRETASEVASLSDAVGDLERLVEQDATERQRVNVAKLITKIVSDLRDEYSEATIETNLEDELWVSADAGLRVALEHALDNALAHNDTVNPTVTVTTRREAAEPYVVIDVADNGPGMPEIERTALEGEITDLEHSEGLGLWLIKSCTESLGGTMTIDDNEPRGTQLSLKVPRTEPPR